LTRRPASDRYVGGWKRAPWKRAPQHRQRCAGGFHPSWRLDCFGVHPVCIHRAAASIACGDQLTQCGQDLDYGLFTGLTAAVVILALISLGLAVARRPRLAGVALAAEGLVALLWWTSDTAGGGVDASSDNGSRNRSLLRARPARHCCLRPPGEAMPVYATASAKAAVYDRRASVPTRDLALDTTARGPARDTPQQ